LYSNAISGAKAKAASYPLASVNLLHFLDASGTLLKMPTGIFIAEPETNDALLEHRQKFIDGAIKRLQDGRLASGGTTEMKYTNTANAFSIFNKTDLGLAVGGYTLCSKVEVQAIPLGGNAFNLKFKNWTVQAFDCYNWDPGKGIGVPGATDNDLCCLENFGKAKHFKVESPAWINTFAASIANEKVTTI